MMKEHFQLKVADILDRKHFVDACVIAGEEGIHRIVKWVHVVEVTSIRNLLNGYELILSTGVAWQENKELFISILQQLIEINASGLCIEMGTYISEIPKEAINIANQHQFPIIVFHKVVPFVEITHDIHSVLINQQYNMISDLENYSQSLNKRLLTIETHEEILQSIFSALDMQIIFRMKDHEYEFVPEITRQEQSSVIQYLKKANHQTTEQIGYAPIYLFGKEYAELFIFSMDIPISEYDLLILDRTSTALAQHLLRDLYVEEKKRVEEFEWLQGWLEGEHPIESINEYLFDHSTKAKTNDAVVLITKLLSLKDKTRQDVTYLKLLFRSVFEQHGFEVFTVAKRNEVIFILLNNRTKKSIKERIKMAIELIKETDFMKNQSNAKVSIGVGRLVNHLGDLHKSYSTAKETLRIQQKMIQKDFYHFYEDLHLYRLISLISNHMDLHELAMEYLQPVIQYDKEYNAKLLETLKAYLECQGSKQETSKKLFIVRQTLYHRLQKLENLLGDNFMEHEKRIAIEFMLLVNDYFSPSSKT